MTGLTIQPDRPDRAYVPGEPITGTISWDLAEQPEQIAVRLVWQTAGKGTKDFGVAAEEVFVLQSLRGEHAFSFAGVEGPYSFSGTLITIAWRVEAYTDPGDAHAELALTLSPTGEEVRP